MTDQKQQVSVFTAETKNLRVDQLINKRELGKGSFGQVFAATDPRTGIELIYKQIPKQRIIRGSDGKEISREGTYNEVKREVSILQKLAEKGCNMYALCLEGWYSDDENYYIATEVLGQYYTLDRIFSQFNSANPKQYADVIMKMIDALTFLHDETKIAHRDIKPENIMVRLKSPVQLRLIDYGLACYYCNGQSPVAGTPAYIAPEILLTRFIPTFDSTSRTDIWSLGAVIWEIVARYNRLITTQYGSLIEEWDAANKTPAAGQILSFTSVPDFYRTYNYLSPIDPLYAKDQKIEATLQQWQKQGWITFSSLKNMLARNPKDRFLPKTSASLLASPPSSSSPLPTPSAFSEIKANTIMSRYIPVITGHLKEARTLFDQARVIESRTGQTQQITSADTRQLKAILQRLKFVLETCNTTIENGYKQLIQVAPNLGEERTTSYSQNFAVWRQQQIGLIETFKKYDSLLALWEKTVVSQQQQQQTQSTIQTLNGLLQNMAKEIKDLSTETRLNDLDKYFTQMEEWVAINMRTTANNMQLGVLLMQIRDKIREYKQIILNARRKRVPPPPPPPPPPRPVQRSPSPTSIIESPSPSSSSSSSPPTPEEKKNTNPTSLPLAPNQVIPSVLPFTSTQLLEWFETQVWEDSKSRQYICSFHNAELSIDNRGGFSYNPEFRTLNEDGKTCRSGYRFLVGTIKYDQEDRLLVLIRRNPKQILIWSTTGVALSQTTLYIIQSIVPYYIGLEPTQPSHLQYSYRAQQVDPNGIITAWIPSIQSPYGLYQFVWNPSQVASAVPGLAVMYDMIASGHEDSLALATTRVMNVIRPFIGYIVGDIERTQTKRQPFINVPWVEDKDKKGPGSLRNKFSQHVFTMRAYLDHVIWKLSQQDPTLICNLSLGENPDNKSQMNTFYVWDPILRQQYPQWNLQNVVPSNLINQINVCRRRFAIADLSIRYAREGNVGVESREDVQSFSTGHANALIFDHTTNPPQLYRYEPNGSPHSAEAIRYAQFVDDFITKEVLPKLTRKYEYVTGNDVCPYIRGAQSIEAQADPNRPGGYCVAWTTMFILLRLLNPTWTIPQIQNRMLDAGECRPLKGKERSQALLNYILGFIRAMDCVIPDEWVQQNLSPDAMRRLLRDTNQLQPIACDNKNISSSLGDVAKIYYYPEQKQGVYGILGFENTCGKQFWYSNPTVPQRQLQDGSIVSMGTIEDVETVRDQKGQLVYTPLDYNQYLALRKTGVASNEQITKALMAFFDYVQLQGLDKQLVASKGLLCPNPVPISRNSC